MGDNETKITDPEKIKAAEMCANPDYETNKQIIDELSVSKTTFYRWKNEQDFINLVNSKIDKYTDRELPGVWEALIEEAHDGNTQAIKLYFEMKDKYRDRKEITGQNGEPIKVDTGLDITVHEAREYKND